MEFAATKSAGSRGQCNRIYSITSAGTQEISNFDFQLHAPTLLESRRA